MQALYSTVLFLHVIASALGLAAMVPPLVAKKGGRVHARAGWVFSGGMLVSAVTGAALSAAWVAAPHTFRAAVPAAEARLSGIFLALIGALTADAVIQAHRALERKHTPGPQVNLRHLGSTLVLIAMATLSLTVGLVAGHLLSVVFGALSLALAARSVVFARSPLPHRGAYLYHHIQSMGTASISAVTAFFVLGGRRLFDVAIFGGASWLMWVLPGLLLGPLFVYWTRTYRQKFERKQARAPRGLDALNAGESHS